MFETYEYKGNNFTVWELEHGFCVFVGEDHYVFDSAADVREFIQYYKGEDNI